VGPAEKDKNKKDESLVIRPASSMTRVKPYEWRGDQKKVRRKTRRILPPKARPKITAYS